MCRRLADSTEIVPDGAWRRIIRLKSIYPNLQLVPRSTADWPACGPTLCRPRPGGRWSGFSGIARQEGSLRRGLAPKSSGTPSCIAHNPPCPCRKLEPHAAVPGPFLHLVLPGSPCERHSGTTAFSIFPIIPSVGGRWSSAVG